MLNKSGERNETQFLAWTRNGRHEPTEDWGLHWVNKNCIMQKDQLCFFQLQDLSFWVCLSMGVSGVPPKMDSWSSFFLLKLPYLRVNPQVSDKPIHPINLSFVKSIHMFDGYIPNYCNFSSGEFSDTQQFCSMPRKHALIAVALLLGETPLERLKGHPKNGELLIKYSNEKGPIVRPPGGSCIQGLHEIWHFECLRFRMLDPKCLVIWADKSNGLRFQDSMPGWITMPPNGWSVAMENHLTGEGFCDLLNVGDREPLLAWWLFGVGGGHWLLAVFVLGKVVQ